MAKHAIEEKEALIELLEHPGLAPLIKELESIKEALARDVLKLDISDADLIKRKAHLDGAAKLLAGFKNRLDSLKAADRKSNA